VRVPKEVPPPVPDAQPAQDIDIVTVTITVTIPGATCSSSESSSASASGVIIVILRDPDIFVGGFCVFLLDRFRKRIVLLSLVLLLLLLLIQTGLTRTSPLQLLGDIAEGGITAPRARLVHRDPERLGECPRDRADELALALTVWGGGTWET
jgi:hypothetical protein